MTLKYSFQEIRGDKIPFVDVILVDKQTGGKTSYRAMIDSGAFMNIFHTDIAQVLGIDLSRIREIGFGGVKESKRMHGKPYIVQIMIMNKGESITFDAYILFSDEISNDGYGLLGRRGFFDQIDEVIFNYKAGKFYLKN